MSMTEETETLAERQENELQVLQSIYQDAVVDMREHDAWKVVRPPEIKIMLQPQESMTTTEVYNSITLYIKCPVDYPESEPEIQLMDHKGISDQHVCGLQSELKSLSRSLIGEVMILELSQHVQKFLHAHNKPPKKSFYDEMMSNKKRQQEQEERQRQESLARLKENEEKQQKKIEEEIQRRQETLREEARKRRQEAKQGALDRRSSSEPSSGGGSEPVLVTPIPKDTEQRKRVSVTPERQTVIAESGSYQKPERRRRTTSTPKKENDSDESAKCADHTGVLVLAFNTKKERMVHRGRCLGHSLRGCTQYAGMDTDTGELVAVTEWTLQWRNPKRKLDLDDKDEDKEQAANYIKQVSSIESEFMSLLRLRHQNLTHYLAFKHSQTYGVITVHVLSEFISGGSLLNVLHNKMAVPMEEIRYYTVQLVDVLNYLHGKAVVHKHLRLSSALLDPQGHVRLADYSIDNRLAELFAAIDATRPGVHFADEKPLAPGRSGKKCDVYMLGIMLLSLAQGIAISDVNQGIPTSLPEELHDFLSKCLDHSERARWSAAQLQEHTFVKTPVHRQLNDVNGREDHTKHKNKEMADEEEDDAVSAIPFIPSSEGGQSRLKNEFEILRWLGKGGFGDVIKVKNKLDGRFYAIKRIPLNPRSKHFTRKITREVKLLSRLNHENVVRYYNSWIEISEEPALSDSTSGMDTTSAETPSPAKPQRVAHLSAPAKFNSFGICDNVEMNVPAAANSSIDWSISMSGSRQMGDNESSSSEDDDEEDDENDVFGISFGGNFLGDSEDDSIVFECGDSTDNATPSETERSEKENVANVRSEDNVLEMTTPVRLQFLYIQMEFCEKSTLRDCIDQGLYEDRDRVWRLFREICEGLAHIHQQGMIHRDLKPVNIFLDSDDQVKIGDFGLATTDIISQQQTSFMDMNITPALNVDPRVSSSKSESLGDGKLTGKVGTALYVSPEIMNTSAASRTHYSQKVDIYSLGVMFFEMCYPPLPTGMERIEVLTALREPSITLPDNFDPKNDMLDQIAILKLLLNHDPSSRPTAEQLLASELLPPPHIEEAELTELFRSTLKQPDTKAYRHMISAIFGQRVDPVTDITFDIDLYKRDKFTPTPLLIQRSVTETLARIFEKHGALRLSTPLLMPKSTLYEHCEQYITMMDSSGGLVSLPYDLRVPFARYVARNNVTSLKRYNVERVYRQKRHPNNTHPRELTECAVDIITPTPSSLLPDAELLHIVSDIVNEFPVLKKRNYFLRINHAMLLRGVLLHCGIPEELYQEVCNILSGAEVQQKLHVQTRLGNLSISDETIMNLYRFIENEGPFGKVASMLRCITKTKGQAASYAKQGLHEMEAIINHTESLNCKLQPMLAMGLVYNMQYYSGTVYQVAASIRRKNRTTMEVLAAGGRYDDLVTKFTKLTLSRGHQGVPPAAVGISISFERLIAARQDDYEWHSRGIVDVLVSSLGQKPLNREKLGVAADLWSVGLRTHVVYDTTQSLEEIQEFGRAMGASQIVILKDLDSGYAKVRSVEKDKVSEKKVQLSDLTNFLQQRVASANCEIPESVTVAGSKLSTQSSQGGGETWGGNSGTGSGSGGSSSNQPTINVTLIMPDKGKIAANTKRRYESQIYNNITGVASVISNKTRIEVIGVELSSSVVKMIATNLEVGQDEAAFEDSISGIMEKHARRDERKYMNKIFEEIHNLKFANNRNGTENRNKIRSSVIVLYGLKDDTLHVFF